MLRMRIALSDGLFEGGNWFVFVLESGEIPQIAKIGTLR